ncbi:NFX1-type zinc finger-containing protein 1 [Homalodisca vitripennis]|nr:NFX1-type zinc finger-containing protein 1 [Homalodisca vitripennis]
MKERRQVVEMSFVHGFTLRRCYSDVQAVEVEKVVPLCGHKVQVKCYKDPTKEHCRGQCSVTLQCGHKCAKRCCDSCSQDDCVVPTQLSVALPCGHKGVMLPCNLTRKINFDFSWMVPRKRGVSINVTEEYGGKIEKVDITYHCMELTCGMVMVTISQEKKHLYVVDVYRPSSGNLIDALDIISNVLEDTYKSRKSSPNYDGRFRGHTRSYSPMNHSTVMHDIAYTSCIQLQFKKENINTLKALLENED